MENYYEPVGVDSITIDELDAVITVLKNRKACRSDGINGELFKYGVLPEAQISTPHKHLLDEIQNTRGMVNV